jgi:hypothetical protein
MNGVNTGCMDAVADGRTMPFQGIRPVRPAYRYADARDIRDIVTVVRVVRDRLVNT